MGTVRDLEAPRKRAFKFKHNGVEVVWGYMPLTAEMVEQVRVSVVRPKPPTKALKDMGAKDLKARQSKGLPITYEDFEDPDYVKAIAQYEDDLSMAFAQTSLGGADPAWLEMPREDFSRDMRTRLPYGVLTDLHRAIQDAIFNLSFSEVEQNLSSSNPGTGTGEESTTPTVS